MRPARSPRRESLGDAGSAIQVSVVRTLEDFNQAVVLRAIVYMGEQSCPYEEEFDGNDFAATHLLVREGGEPVATMRLRWFADFAKFERICVKKSHRGTAAVRKMMQAAFDLAARKGYRKVFGHIARALLPLWQRSAGMRARPHRPTFVFSDIEYIEVERDLDPHPDALSINAPPLKLLRPEGAWDKPGVLDRSALRGAARAAKAR